MEVDMILHMTNYMFTDMDIRMENENENEIETVIRIENSLTGF